MKKALVSMMILIAILVLAMPQIACADSVSGDFSYSLNTDGSCTITAYSGEGGDISIPATLDGHDVRMIGCRRHHGTRRSAGQLQRGQAPQGQYPQS